jgi:acyl dehydratase
MGYSDSAMEKPMSRELYYNDFAVGQRMESARSITMHKADTIAFAHSYDPQPFHIDEESAKETVVGELIASGWHTAAVSMRLKLETDLRYVAGGLLGLGVENLRWPRPTMPGDTVRIVITILEKRLSNSRPDKGIIKYKLETINQNNELVMEMVTAVIVPVEDKTG